MTQEEKELLIKDLCVRLPYGVMYDNRPEQPKKLLPVSPHSIEDIKLYLRPMSSMTEDEQRTLDSMCNGVEMVSRLSGLKMFDKAFDWLNAHHFDYRGLIEMGLALEAPEGMYK